ncbi:fibronectin type-III domain-containing protein 3a-like [Polypterus senegalus]|uniref:fibronectin type-III domain-containing protein 3a-like n=1 Tax=Polypterus senegalus TaxID=55291 RepID=UPI0019640190|nr:fibronectin type-III domain-containing protein 3a-like [Polypterus senegalus]
MNIPNMMADQLPSLEATTLLSEVPILPHMLNPDSAQQVILVQVNPGETFTIRTDDGHIQCIPGPAHVPMMSPNGSMPPIFVPPGYMSQVVEENGVRKVIVLPHTAEFHHSVTPAPPHLTHYLQPHPTMLHHYHVYPAIPGNGELPYHFMHQPALQHIYTEQEAMALGRSSLIPRDERTLKMQEHLRKRLKDKQLGFSNSNKLSSPPLSPYKMHHEGQNGYGKGHLMTAMPPRPMKPKYIGRTRSTSPAEDESSESEVEVKRVEDHLVNISKPTISDIQSRTAVLSWHSPVNIQNGELNGTPAAPSITFDVMLSNSGRDGSYKSIYTGKELTFTLRDLQPATEYHVRLLASCGSARSPLSDVASFKTECCEPDVPAVPKLFNRTKNSLFLQWKAPTDNGLKLTGYVLEFDEGKGSPFKMCYSGPLKQYKLSKLSPLTRYSFRLAAKNDAGMSNFSKVVTYSTAGSVPPAPGPPQLSRAGVTWLSLEWSAPTGSCGDEALTYILEMEEEATGYGFKPKHNGEGLSFIVRGLRRSTSYKFRVLACNSEGKSHSSEVVEYSTIPDKPDAPSRPSTKGRIHARCLKIVWDPPNDDGGAVVNKYVLEMSGGLNGNKWDTVYNGSLREHLCDHLTPGTWYRFRVYCMSSGGQSQVSEVFVVQTAAAPPGQCQPLCLVGRTQPRELPLQWVAPSSNGGSAITEYTVEICEKENGKRVQIYQGPETEFTANNLLPGQTYCFWVKASNQAGSGPFSDVSQISTAPEPPDQCLPPYLSVRTATCVVASWEAPACNGAEVREYRLEWGIAEGCMQVIYTGSSLSFEVKGLIPATAYFCRVQAINVAGAGLFGKVATVTTMASVPGVISIFENLDEEHLPSPLPCPFTCLAVQWQEPCCNGCDITGYNIEFGEQQLISIERVTTCVLENLQPDTMYRIRVQAVNSIGAGPFSQVLKTKTKALPPDPPHLECAAFGHQSLKLRWGEGPSKPLLTSSTQYCLQMEDRYGRFVCIYSGPCHTYKVQRLSESTAYHFRIQAQSASGEGLFSHVYTFSTTKSPPPQLKAPKVQKSEENVFEVTWEPLQPMRGDVIVYALQLLTGRGTEQVYKGPETSFAFRGFPLSSELRFRVGAGRQYKENGITQELWGQYSPISTIFTQQQSTLPKETMPTACEEHSLFRGTPISDEQCALLLLLGFALIAVLFAVVIQYFVIK